MGLLIPEERRENKWVDGIAIWIAVALVSLVGRISFINFYGVAKYWHIHKLYFHVMFHKIIYCLGRSLLFFI